MKLKLSIENPNAKISDTSTVLLCNKFLNKAWYTYNVMNKTTINRMNSIGIGCLATFVVKSEMV